MIYSVLTIPLQCVGRKSVNLTISSPLVTGKKRIINFKLQLQRLFGGSKRDLPGNKSASFDEQGQ